MIYFIVFLVVLVFNLYITLFGRSGIDNLKQKLSIREYVRELNSSLTDLVGDHGATAIKIVALILAGVVVLVNAIFFLGCVVAVAIGTFAAKKAYQVSFISNWLNKLATYINRIR